MRKKVMLRGYGGTFHFPKSGGTVTKINWDNQANQAMSNKEIKYFKKAKPSAFPAYLSMDMNKIQTWKGDSLGEVLQKKETSRRGFAGDKVFSIYAKGINNKIYKGFGSSGNLINLKEKK